MADQRIAELYQKYPLDNPLDHSKALYELSPDDYAKLKQYKKQVEANQSMLGVQDDVSIDPNAIDVSAVSNIGGEEPFVLNNLGFEPEPKKEAGWLRQAGNAVANAGEQVESLLGSAVDFNAGLMASQVDGSMTNAVEDFVKKGTDKIFDNPASSVNERATSDKFDQAYQLNAKLNRGDISQSEYESKLNSLGLNDTDKYWVQNPSLSHQSVLPLDEAQVLANQVSAGKLSEEAFDKKMKDWGIDGFTAKSLRAKAKTATGMRKTGTAISSSIDAIPTGYDQSLDVSWQEIENTEWGDGKGGKLVRFTSEQFLPALVSSITMAKNPKLARDAMMGAGAESNAENRGETGLSAESIFYSSPTSLVATAMDKMGIDAVLAKRGIDGRAVAGVIEAGTEGTQEALQYLGSLAGNDKEFSWDKLKSIVSPASLLGGVVGASMANGRGSNTGQANTLPQADNIPPADGTGGASNVINPNAPTDISNIVDGGDDGSGGGNITNQINNYLQSNQTPIVDKSNMTNEEYLQSVGIRDGNEPPADGSSAVDRLIVDNQVQVNEPTGTPDYLTRTDNTNTQDPTAPAPQVQGSLDYIATGFIATPDNLPTYTGEDLLEIAKTDGNTAIKIQDYQNILKRDDIPENMKGIARKALADIINEKNVNALVAKPETTPPQVQQTAEPATREQQPNDLFGQDSIVSNTQRINEILQSNQQQANTEVNQTDLFSNDSQQNPSTLYQTQDSQQNIAEQTGLSQTQASQTPQVETVTPQEGQSLELPPISTRELIGKESEVEVQERDVPTQLKIVEADDLIPNQNENESQYRERGRDALLAQVSEIANKLKFKKLRDNYTMGEGAPTVARDGKAIIAGNGRTQAVQQAYRIGGERSQQYKADLVASAEEYGIDPQAVANMKNPILVRQLKEDVDVANVAIDSNESDRADMSAYEQAGVDTRRLPDLSNLKVDKFDSINNVANRQLIQQFVSAYPVGKRGALVAPDGTLSKEGLRRFQNAILRSAYGDTKAVADMIENTDATMQNTINAMIEVAPDVVKTKANIESGVLLDGDISEDITSAIAKIQQLRKEGKTVQDYVNQLDLFAENNPSPVVIELIQYIDDNARSSKAIRELLKRYYANLNAIANVNEQALGRLMFNDSTNLDGIADMEAGTVDREKLTRKTVEELQNEKATEKGSKQSSEQGTEQSSELELTQDTRPTSESNTRAGSVTEESNGDGNGTSGSEEVTDTTNTDGRLLAPNGKPSNLTPEQYRQVRTPQFKAWFGDWQNDPENASKVLDENGEPLVVYHGTDEEFNSFDEAFLGNSSGDKGMYGAGFYVSPSIEESLSYGDNSMNLFADIKKPYDFISSKDWYVNGLGDKVLMKNINKTLLFPEGYTYSNYMEELDSRASAIRESNPTFTPSKAKLEASKELTKKYANPKTFGADLKISYDIKSVGEEKITEYLKSMGYDGSVGISTVNKQDGNLEYVAFKPTQLKSATDNNGEFSSTNPDIRFSRRPSPPKDLVLAHNLTEKGIVEANKLGGLPAPSLAVVRTGVSDFTNYGEVTLLAEPSLLADSKIRTFDADVYSPRQPRATYDIDYAKYDKMVKGIDTSLQLRTPSDSELERSDGFSTFLRSEGSQYLFLKEKGKLPRVKKVKQEPLITKMMKVEGSDRAYVLRDKPKFKELAEKYFDKKREEAIQEVQGIVNETGDTSYLDHARTAYHNEDGSVKVNRLQLLAKKVEKAVTTNNVDTTQFSKDMASRLRQPKLKKEYEQWAESNFENLVNRRELFRGYTNSGNERVSPYTMNNVLKEMTKTVRNGEGTFYGAGSIRATLAKEFVDISDIQDDRNKIVSSEEFQKIKDEASEKLSQAIEDLKPFYKYDTDDWSYFDNAGLAIASGNKEFAKDFKVNARSKAIVNDLQKYLIQIPTEYFEAKAGRAVGFDEFSTAVVPNNIGAEALQVLQNAGLKVVKYNPNIEGSRTKKIEQQKNLRFSKSSPTGLPEAHADSNAMYDFFGDMIDTSIDTVVDFQNDTTGEFAGVQGYYDRANDRTVVFLDNIMPIYVNGEMVLTKAENARWVTWHELFHRGMNLIGAKGYRNALDKAGTNKFIRELAKKIQIRYGYSMDIAIEEAMAETRSALQMRRMDSLRKQYGIKTPYTSTVGATINRWLQNLRNVFNKLAGREVNMTDSELIKMINAIGDVGLSDIQARRMAVSNQQSQAMAQVQSVSLAVAEVDAVREEFEGTEEWLKAPNGADSNLTERQWLQVRTPAFKNWFGDWENDPQNASKVVDENGEPLVVYHGTVNDFEAFDPLWYEVGSAVGGGIYTTTSSGDVAENYEGGGADFDNRLERLAEQIENGGYDGRFGDVEQDRLDEAEDDAYTARQIARELISDDQEILLELYVNSRNPLALDPEERFVFDSELSLDPYIEQAREEVDQADYEDESDYEDAVTDMAYELQSYDENPEYEDGNFQAILEAIEVVDNSGVFDDWDSLDIIQELRGRESFTPLELYEVVTERAPYATVGDYGELASSELFSSIVYEAGFDGIKMNARFFNEEGVGGRGGWNLGGIEEGDYHYIVPEPTQVKSSTDNVGTFDGTNPKLRSSAKPLPVQLLNIKDKYVHTDGYMKAPNGEPTKLTERQWLEVRTPEFKAWFGDWENDPQNASQAVDSNGEPLIAYHGTPNEFYEFDRETLGKNTGNIGYYGKGFYFTFSKDIAEGYFDSSGGGQVMETYLNIRNPFYNSHDNMKPYLDDLGYQKVVSGIDNDYLYEQLLGFDPKLEGIIGEARENDGRISDEAISDYLDNGGRITEDNTRYTIGQLEDALFDNFDNRMSGQQIESLQNIIDIDSDQFIEGYITEPRIEDVTRYGERDNGITETLINEGYDSVVSQEDITVTRRGDMTFSPEVVVFNSTQVKSATGNIGTFDGTNPDIRFSRADDMPPTTQEAEEVRARYEGTDEWLKAPNGADTALNEAQWIQVRTPSFKRWFGDWENDPESASKVLDENGEPLAVYHWSNAKDITEFHQGGIGSHFGTLDSAKEIFNIKGKWNDGTVVTEGRYYELFLNIKNPLSLDDIGQHTIEDYKENIVAELEQEVQISPEDETALLELGNKDQSKLRSILSKYGFDGFTYINEYEDAGSQSFVTLTPTQSKSAVENNGDFDPENPDIRYSRTPEERRTVPQRLRLRDQAWQEFKDNGLGASVGFLRDKNKIIDDVLTGRLISAWNRAFRDTARGNKIFDNLFDNMGELQRLDEKYGGLASELHRAFRMVNAKINSETEQVVEPVVDRLKTKLADKFNELKDKYPEYEVKYGKYQFLHDIDMIGKYVKHGKERNATTFLNSNGDDIAGSGMTDAEIDELIAWYQQRPELIEFYEQIYRDDIKPMLDLTTQELLDAGIMTHEMVDARADWEWYVPLKGKPSQAIIDPLENKVINDLETIEGGIRGKKSGGVQRELNGVTFHRATGRYGTEAENIFVGVFGGVQQAIAQKKLQEPKRALKAYLETDEGKEVLKGDIQQHIDNKAFTLDSNGNLVYTENKLKVNDDTSIVLQEDGVTWVMTVNNEQAIKGMKSVTATWGNQPIVSAIRGIQTLTRMNSSVFTRFNIGFQIFNKLRDSFQQYTLLLSDSPSTDKAGNYLEAVVNLGKRLVVANSSAKNNFRYTMSLASAVRGKPSEAYKEYEQWLERYRELGGVTTYSKLLGGDTLTNIQREYNKEVEQKGFLGKANQIRQRMIDAIVDFFDRIGDSLELTSRVAMFKALVDAGVDEDVSALYVKNTMNFETKGDIGRGLGVLYAFSTSIIYDTRRTSSALFRNREGHILFALLVAGNLLQMALADQFGADDEDDIPYIDKLPFYQAMGYTNFIWGERGEGIKIPKGWGMSRVASGMAVIMRRLANGRMTDEEALKHMTFDVAMGNFSPVQIKAMEGSVYDRLIQTGTPTVALPITQIATNTSFSGSLVYPNEAFLKDGMLEYESGYNWTEDTYKEMARIVYEQTGYDMYPEQLKLILRAYVPMATETTQVTEGLVDQMIGSTDTRETGAKIPVLSKFNSFPPRYEQRLYRDRVKKLKHLERVIDNAERNDRDEILEKYEDVNIERWLNFTKAIDKSMKNLHEKSDKLKARYEGDELVERLREVEDEEKAILIKFNRRWEEEYDKQ